MRMALAYRIVNALRDGRDAERAAEEAVGAMSRRIGGEAGCIVIDRNGNIGTAHSTQNLACAWQTSEIQEPLASLGR